MFKYKQLHMRHKSRKRLKNNDRRSLFNTRVYHSLKWLIKTYGVCTSVWDPTLRYMRFLDHIYINKGLQTAIERIKFDRLKVLQYLSGNYQIGAGLTHDGLPKKLYGLIPLIRSWSILEIRYTLTLLYSLRRFNLPLQPKLETITSPSSAGYFEWIFKYIPGFSKALVKRLSRKHKSGNKLKFPSWQEYHLTVKGSPSKGQALVNCLQDLVSLPKSLINSISIFGGDQLSENMALLRKYASELSEVLDQPLESEKTTIRRIVAFPDSEGKTRLIAIGDYFSQTCLKPLHSYLNTVLSSIPQDQTFNQGKGLKELPFNSETTYYSFDLSAFTDRFPIKILLGLLSYNYGQAKALAWYDIIAGYDFEYTTPKGIPGNLNYKVGNPMGFYTSWPLTTLCHHFILYVCCQECGISWNTAKYKILGDDIIIYSKVLAEKYQELIHLIGVDIQLQKSHIGNSLFEFAKRNFTPYGEISPFPLTAILSESKSYIGFLELLKSQQLRGWFPVKSRLNAALTFYTKGPFSIRSKNRFREVSRIKELLHLSKWKEGYDLSSLDLIRQVQGRYDYPQLSCNMLNIAKAMLNHCIVRCFERSASAYAGDVQGRLERALLEFSAHDDGRIEALYAHPYSFVYGKYVEESYLSEMKMAYENDTKRSGNWSPDNSILVSSDAEIMFSRRTYKSRTHRPSTSILLKEVHEVCNELFIMY